MPVANGFAATAFDTPQHASAAAIAVADACGDWSMTVAPDSGHPARWSVLGVSRSLRATFGLGGDEERLGDLIDGDARALSLITDAWQDKRRCWADVKVRHGDGDMIAVGADFAPLQDGDVWLVRLGAGGRLGERMAELQATERRMRTMAAEVPVGIGFSEAGVRLGWVNERCAEIFDRACDQLVGLGWVDAVRDDQREDVVDAVFRVLDGSDGEELVVRTGGGRSAHIRLARVQHDGGGGFVATFEDITDRVSLEARLAHEATHDALTGLPNRTAMHTRIEEALSARRDGELVAVMFVDLDDFKKVNDSLGHNVGDQLLVQVADRLVTSVRAGDVIARFGGDEFVVCCPGLTDSDQVRSIVDRVVAEVGRPLELNGMELRVTPSVGVVTASGPATADQLLRDADVAMYDAKRAGKGRWSVCTDEMRAGIINRLELESELRQAISAREIRVHYQPIVDACTGRIVALEALSRWSRNGVDVPPAEFVAVAEGTDMVMDLSRHVLDVALGHLACWRAQIPGADDLYVSVNASARHFSHGTLAEDCRSALEAHGLLGERVLQIEVTETSLLDDPDEANRTIAELQDLGVMVALDDFGTGFSSLSYLLDVGVDVVKIDGAFTQEVHTSTRSRGVCEAVVRLADALAVSVVAERIESLEQAQVLCDMGCSLVQGYLYGRAEDSTDTAALLAAGPLACVLPANSPAPSSR